MFLTQCLISFETNTKEEQQAKLRGLLSYMGKHGIVLETVSSYKNAVDYSEEIPANTRVVLPNDQKIKEFAKDLQKEKEAMAAYEEDQAVQQESFEPDRADIAGQEDPNT